jgi:hypothetical protein
VLGPIVPTPSPSATVAPFATVTEPRWTSVTDHPSSVWIVTVRPFDGTVPANVTIPLAGARTDCPSSPATSIPRCAPDAYGADESNENCRRTRPSVGQVQAPAAGTTASATVSGSRSRRIHITSCLI